MAAKEPYDQDLLASAPAATKAQLQEGYTTDLLDPNHGKTSSSHLPQSEQSPPADRERGSLSPAKELNGRISSTKLVPFWRTTKGIIIIIVAIVVVLAAVIGGAVGGTRKKAKGTVNQGVASAPSSSTTTSTTTMSPVITPGVGQGVTTTPKSAPTPSGVVVGTQSSTN